MAVKKKKTSKNLAHGRPPTLQKPKSISRQATKALINAHHVLEKRKVQAVAKGDTAQQAAIDKEISALGGIEKYQQASLQGQRNDRGGDSSRVLMEWLKPALPALRDMTANPLRMLEVGALSTTNDCSKSRLFAMERIDLNSQGEGILQQDFMARPLPTDDSGRFDIISLSLVLNFVPDAQGRGNMLLRTLEFLRLPGTHGSELGNFFPTLFLVLPAPCVTNSRYMDESRLEAIMTSLGYTKTKSKLTQKLVYYLWARTNAMAPKLEFSKTQIRTGGSRNNFAIILQSSTA
ncbi:nucleolus protein [Seiridium cupressi]